MRRMKYIHDRPDWPLFRWDAQRLGAILGRVRHKQGRLLGKMESLGFELRQEATLSTLTSDVVKSSAIEGEHFTTGDVRSSVARRLGLDEGGLQPAGRDVEAIVEVMVDATQRFDSPLTGKRLRGWHAALFPTAISRHSRSTVGAWRTDRRGPMQVVAGRIGNERLHFEAPAAQRVPGEMRKLLTWFEKGPKLDSVLRAGLAHLWFVTVHPFDDGNGRIGRAVADMALARSDGSRERFYSMSTEIERCRKDYYLILEATQKGDLDVTAWLEWFLACLDRAIDASEVSLARVLSKAKVWEVINQSPVNERQRAMINRLLGDFFGALNTSKYAKLAKCSNDTALRDIQELVSRRILVANAGRGRSTSYQLRLYHCPPPD